MTTQSWPIIDAILSRFISLNKFAFLFLFFIRQEGNQVSSSYINKLEDNQLFVCFYRDRIYALQRQKERLEEQVGLANKALAESAAKPKK